jgi:hypothetical protein
MSGCKKEQQPVVQPGEGGQATDAAGAPLPKITFAEIISTGPPSTNPLTVQYALDGGAVGDGRVVYRWYSDGVPLEGVTGNVLTPDRYRKGERIEVEVIPTDGTRMGIPFRTPSLVIKNTPPVASSVVLRPVPAFVGDVVKAMGTASDRDNDTVTFEYQWMVNNSIVPGQADSLDTSGLKKRDGISVMATPYDGEERGAPVQSTVVFLSNRNPEIISAPSSNIQGGVYTYQMAAKDADGDPLTYALVTAPDGMTIDARTGLIRWEPPTASGPVEMAVKISVDDGDGGMAFQEFRLTLELR